MQKKRVVQAIVVFSVICLTFGTIQTTYAQAPEDDVFAVVKLNDPQTLLPAIGQLVDKFQPGMGGLINPMMVGNMVFKNPNWTGMDMAGEYSVVVMNPMIHGNNPLAIIVPLTNNDEYMGALSQMLTGGEEADGIYTFTQQNQKNVFVALAGNSGILTESSEIAAQVKSLVEANSQLLSEVPVVKGQVTASIALNKILVALQPMVDMLKQQLLMGVPQGAGEGSGEELKQTVEAELNVLLSLISQMDKIQLGVGLEPEGVRIAKAVLAMSDSNLEKFMAAQSPQKSSLLGVIPADSAILASGTINFTPEFTAVYIHFLKAMVGVAEDMDEETLGKLVGWAEKAFAVFGGDFAAGALSPTSDTLITEIISVKDSAQAKELIGQYPELLKTMSGMYEELGMDFQMKLADTSEVQGGEILNYDFNINAEMIPDPEGQEVFKTLFGENLTLPIGFTENHAIVGFGKDGPAQVENIIQSLDSGAEVGAGQTPAMFGLPEENNLFVYLSVPKILSWAIAKNLPEVPPFEVSEGPGLAMTSRFIDSHMENELFLPIDELLILKKLADQAQGAPPAQ